MRAIDNPTEMQALVWTGPRSMAMQTVPVPQPGPNEVLLRVGATGICGSELSGFLGHNSLRKPPLIMGHETVGTIAHIPDGTHLKLADGSDLVLGQRVTVNPLVVCGECDRCLVGKSSLCRKRQLLGAHRPGAFAGYVAVPAGQCWPLPDHLSDVEGALTEPLACGVHALEMVDWEDDLSDSSLLIIGAGTIGLCCLAVALTAGVGTVVVSDVSGRRLQIAGQWGASSIIDASQTDMLAAMQALQPQGVSAVIDAVGMTATRTQAIQAVVPGGAVVFVGLHEEVSTISANYIVRQEIKVQGSFGYSNEDFEEALRLLSAGVIPGTNWLQERPLADGPAAFAELVDGKSTATKIVLRIV